jgi:thioredoxin reductase (NADPH)
VTEITPTHVVIDAAGHTRGDSRDGVFLLTGYHPDVDLMRTRRHQRGCETLAPELNMETFETNVPNLFIAGGAIAGRRPATSSSRTAVSTA